MRFNELESPDDVRLIAGDHTVQQWKLQLHLLRIERQGTHVLRQAGAAERKARPQIAWREVQLGVLQEDVHYLMAIDTGHLADGADLIAKIHLDRVPEIVGVLRHLRDLDRGLNDRRGKMLEKRGDDVCGAIVVGTNNDLRRIVIIKDRRRLSEKFGIDAHAEFDARTLA